MNAGQFGALLAVVGISLICAMVAKWVAHQILRANLEKRYAIAAVAAFLPQLLLLVSIGVNALQLLGALIALGMVLSLWWHDNQRNAR